MHNWMNYSWDSIVTGIAKGMKVNPINFLQFSHQTSGLYWSHLSGYSSILSSTSWYLVAILHPKKVFGHKSHSKFPYLPMPLVQPCQGDHTLVPLFSVQFVWLVFLHIQGRPLLWYLLPYFIVIPTAWFRHFQLQVAALQNFGQIHLTAWFLIPVQGRLNVTCATWNLPFERCQWLSPSNVSPFPH